MIIITGDSHTCGFNFRKLPVPHIRLEADSVTMYRVGRDKEILNFHSGYLGEENIFIVGYGEIDNRCHIHRQVLLGRAADEVINHLVDEYFKAIKHIITTYKAIIVCSLVPPTRQSDYEEENGPITHEYPFVGTDEERVRYCKMMNERIEKNCKEYGYHFLNFTDHYAREDGTLQYEKSDKKVHIVDNDYILDMLRSVVLDMYLKE